MFCFALCQEAKLKKPAMQSPTGFSKRNVVWPSEGRAPARPMSRAAVPLLLSVLLMSPGRCVGDPGDTPNTSSTAPASATLTVSVSETTDSVRLRISASGDIEPGSLEVRFADRKAFVLARDAEGRPIQ